MSQEVSPDEVIEVLSRDSPPDVRLAARLPGKHYVAFHEAEQLWTYMHEAGLVDQGLYEKALASRFSFLVHVPAAAASDYIRGVSEAKNPRPLLAMVSQSVGATRVGNRLVSRKRAQVPGMDARGIQALINEPQMRRELSFEGGLEILEVLAHKLQQEGRMEDEETRSLVSAARSFRKQLARAGILPNSSAGPPAELVVDLSDVSA